MKKIRKYHYITILIFIFFTSHLIVSCAKSPTLLPYGQSRTLWDESVDKHISDTQRANKLKQLGIQLDKIQQSLATDIEQLNKKGASVNADYFSTKGDLQELFEDFTTKRDTVLNQYRNVIFSMRAEVTSDEWDELIN